MYKYSCYDKPLANTYVLYNHDTQPPIILSRISAQFDVENSRCIRRQLDCLYKSCVCIYVRGDKRGSLAQWEIVAMKDEYLNMLKYDDDGS